MVYSAITIANKFIDLAKDEGGCLTNMQLQKMVYIAHGFNLALRDTKLYYEDTRAWNFGPVVPELYEQLRQYGSNEVTKSIGSDNAEELDEDSLEIVKAVYENYKQYSGMQLSNLTHQENTPWSKSWKNNKYGVIPADDIYESYKDNHV